MSLFNRSRRSGAERSAPVVGRRGVLSVPVHLSPPAGASFTFLETIDYEREHDDAQMSGYHARERRALGRYTTWRDDHDRVIYDDDLVGDSALLPMKDVVYHTPSGAVAAAGFGRTEFYADPAEHEWAEYLWIRPPQETQFVQVRSDGEAWAVDIAPDGSFAAGLWWVGASSSAVCAVVDMQTCTARQLTVVTRSDGRSLSGGEEIRISPDGRWVLVTGPVDDDAITLVEVATGRVVVAPCSGFRTAGWWPQRSPSSLLVGWVGADREYVLGALDLSTARLEPLGKLQFPDGVRDDSEYTFGVQRLAVGADGLSLLGVAYVATEREWSMSRRPRGRVVRGALLPEPAHGVAGRIDRVEPAFLGDGAGAVVEHRRARWLDHPAQATVDVAESLLAGARAPVTLPHVDGIGA